MAVIDEPTDSELQAFKRFVELFPHGSDLTLVILRGHLLIEEQIRTIVAERVVHSDCVGKAKLSAYQAIWLARAYVGEMESQEVWDAVLKLNELRNKIAHRIEPGNVRSSARDIVQLVGTGTWHKDELVQFEFALWRLFVFISALVRKPRGELVNMVPDGAT